jgi:hypothetical protein
MISCVIDAKEGKDVATVNIPGALLDEVVHMRLELYNCHRRRTASLL